jgi:UDP-N-acetylglucosamine--N-acetylmuramyl-(pentapeptide) pyrophosphoryl-undecaprenol N-acetylglucosamine transferase
MNLVIAAGGTGGHLYPAVALAQEFRRHDPAAAVLFIGTTRGIEGRVLPREGFELRTITARPVMGRGAGRALTAVGALPAGVVQAAGILRARRADLVIAIGGYTSPPVVLAAWLLRIPRVILEPNAYPGMANRCLAPFADRVFLAFAEATAHFPRARVRVVGTPIRRAFFEGREERERREKRERRDERDARERRTLLIFGGSQGAAAINHAVTEALSGLRQLQPDVAIIHQTGEADYARVKAAYDAAGVQAEVAPFLFDMPGVLRSADLVVARAGAVTVAELTACGRPAILIPLPHAIHQHQHRNAKVLEAAGAALLLPQADLSGGRLVATIGRLLGDEHALRDMGARSRGLGRPDAAARIVAECRALLGQGT